MNLHELKAAILDMDGVITQTATVHARAWKEMFDEYLRRRERDHGESHSPFDIERDYRQYVDGKPRYDGVRSFLESRGIELAYGDKTDEPTRETLCGLGNRKNQVFNEVIERDGVELYEDTVEQIHNWKNDGLKVGVITSSRNCETVLKAANLLEIFDVKVDGNDADRLKITGKPAPDVFLYAAKQMGVKKEQALIVEDAISGVQAGRAGQFALVVGVARDHDGDDLQEAGADIVLRDLRELQVLKYCPPGENCLKKPSSAMDHAAWLTQRIAGSRLALFLDYDGTLTPIVRRPEDATLSQEMRSLLGQLAEHCTVAIVSGRDRRNAEEMVQVEKLVYAGSHGFDIHGPGDLNMEHEDAQQALPELDQAEQELRQKIQSIDGAHVERKKFAIAIHYREVVGEENIARVGRTVEDVRSQHPRLRKKGGKKIFELQPDIEWHKGHAVMWLAESLDLKRPGVIIAYIGDDVTDEDAFRVLRRGAGIGIKVDARAADTDAIYYLRDCAEAQRFLESLLASIV